MIIGSVVLGARVSDTLSDVIDRIVEARRQELFCPAVASAIQGIREAYNRDWERSRLSQAKRLLTVLPNGVPVAVLSVCGHGTAETRYTKYLAYMLDYRRPHGLGTRYLDSLLAMMRVSSRLLPEDLDTAKSRVYAEQLIGTSAAKDGGRVSCDCDVVVEFPCHVLFIEQKINSSESPNPRSDDSQLQRYDSAISTNSRYADMGKIRVYLTPEGRQPASSDAWIPLSHNDLAEAGLSTLRDPALSVAARENLKRFIVDVLSGPYGRAEDEVAGILELAHAATADSDFINRLRFDQAVDRNHMLVDLLMGEPA